MLEELRQLGEVEVIENVAVVTVVGRRIRERLPDLGRSMEAIADVQVRMLSASSEGVALYIYIYIYIYYIYYVGAHDVSFVRGRCYVLRCS
jgi:aspartokinase